MRVAGLGLKPIATAQVLLNKNKASSDCGGFQSMRVVGCARASTEFTAKWPGTVIMTRCFAPMQ